jgi:hypothetical protein
MVSGLAKPSNQLLLDFLPTIPWIFLKNSLVAYDHEIYIVVKLLLLYLSFDIISRAIKTFDGSQANLRNWLNEVDKFAFINRIDDNATEFHYNINFVIV